MKGLSRFQISAFAAVLCLAAQAQVVTQLGKENMRIPVGERPSPGVEPTTTRPCHVETDSTAAYYQLADSAQIHASVGQWAEAERCLRAALASDPDNDTNALLLSNLGTVQRRQGHLDDALRTYNLSIDLTPNAVTLLLNRAALLLEMGRTAEAEADLERVRTLDASDDESRYSLGMLAVERHDFARAESLFNEILQFAPRSALANEGLGLMYKEQGKHARAIERLSAAIDAHADARLLANRADCLLTEKRLTEAADDIQRALELDPDDGYLYVLRAKLNKLRWNLDDAARDIDEAVNHGVERMVAEKLLK
ncbi:MAG: tetratricopeptide repeat protein [Muribaculaceae bacterium]|nr:tetratricopeptide repeat protein [Muribaculaceae bacterium]